MVGREPSTNQWSATSGLAAASRLVRSPSFRYAIAYGLSGVAFVGANLLLARALPSAEYGRLSLAIALIYLGGSVGPFGADGVVNRHPIRTSYRLAARGLGTSVLAAGAFAAVGRVLYDLSPPFLLAVLFAVIGGGTARLAAAQFQSRQRFAASLSVAESPNLVLLIGAAVVLVAGIGSGEVVAGALALGFLGSAAVGWLVLFGDRRAPADGSFRWSEAVSYAGITWAILVLIQLERLVIPKVLTLEDLATYAVLAAVAGSPFRMLQQGLAFTLLPRLRAAAGPRERRHLLMQEAKVALVVVTAAAVAVWYLAPLVVEWFLEGRYVLGPALVAAALVAGVVKVVDQFTKSTVTAVGSTRQLMALNVFGWGAVGLGTLAAVVLARWGLTGVIYGVTIGWAARVLVGGAIAASHLRDRAPSPEVTRPARPGPGEEPGPRPGGPDARGDAPADGSGGLRSGSEGPPAAQ